MSTLYERLLQICTDQGIPDPRKKDVQALLKCSSGLPSQIEQKGDKAKLGTEKLLRLTELGYLPRWIISGEGDKKLNTSEPDGISDGSGSKISGAAAGVAAMAPLSASEPTAPSYTEEGGGQQGQASPGQKALANALSAQLSDATMAKAAEDEKLIAMISQLIIGWIGKDGEATGRTPGAHEARGMRRKEDYLARKASDNQKSKKSDT